jgi:hypothetical protein
MPEHDLNLDREASPGTPGAGYQDTNERDVAAKQKADVRDSEASGDETVDLSDVNVLPGTGGPDDVGDENVPADYDRTGHAGDPDEHDEPDDPADPDEPAEPAEHDEHDEHDDPEGDDEP